MKVKQFVFNHFMENCFVVWDEASKEASVIDPGAYGAYEVEELVQFVEKNGLTLTHVLLTHAHIDHIAGLKQVCEHFNIPVTLHADGLKLLGQAEVYGSVMRFDQVANMSDLRTVLINDGDRVGPFECRYVPGHCPGSMAFVLHEERMVFTGDALFRGSIGRTDLPGGNYDQLIKSIRTQILTLDDLYEVLPGHGDTTSVGEEKMYNGFLQ